MSAADDWNDIYHAGHHPAQRDQASTTPAWEDFANWALYLSQPRVVLLSDETGTVLTVAEEQVNVAGLRIAAVVMSFDLVGGAK